jgi:hypothetical protein
MPETARLEVCNSIRGCLSTNPSTGYQQTGEPDSEMRWLGPIEVEAKAFSAVLKLGLDSVDGCVGSIEYE